MPWPLQSPDLNLIDHFVDTNGDQIKKKKLILTYLASVARLEKQTLLTDPL